jgi:LuxR family maltose regulon positive regulatory protein
LAHQPPTLHLVIATRADPPLPLARLRGRRELTELRAKALRFTQDETDAFFRQMSLQLSREEIDALEHRTEGWITGLQLAALSLRDQEDAAAFIADFTGSHRYVLDYLTEEVLRRQPPEIRAFLLQTSILDRMTAPLCEALTEPESSPPAQATLERLEAENLFVVPLDEQRRWYRYHRLFADLLRARLEDEQPKRVPRLHARASAWYERHGMVEAAFQHVLAGGNAELAARIAETHGRPMLFRGELTTLVRWIESLPDDRLGKSPELSALSAWVHLLIGQIPAVERYTRQTEQLLSDSDHRLHGDIAAIRAYVAAERGELARATTLAEQALQRLGDEQRGEQGVAYFVLGGARLMQGDLTGAAQAARQAADVGQQGGNIHIVLPALNTLVSVQMRLGALHEAQSTVERALDKVTLKGGELLPIAAGPLSALAELAAEWNDLERAAHYAQKAVELSERWGNQDNLCANYLTLSEIMLAQNAIDEAESAYEAAQTVICNATVMPSFLTYLRTAQARLWLTHGNLAALTTWIRDTELPTPLTPVHADEALTLARAHLALDDLDAATQVLTHVREMARAHKMTTARIGALALQAVVHRRQGESSQAQAVLLEALALAEPEGYVRRFIDLGAEMTALLREINRSQQPLHLSRYVESLLQAAGEPPETSPRQPQPALIEPLSERELEVLATVAEGLTNRETAQRLFIAESTVKSHLNSVYGKLDVSNRTEAVAKARKLKLLPK